MSVNCGVQKRKRRKTLTTNRNRQLKGKKFRRQHALDKYVQDFYCHECKLAVELDRAIHQKPLNRQYDEARTGDLNKFEMEVIRFRNEEVMNNVEEVFKKIKENLL